MKKLKHEAELVKAAILAGMKTEQQGRESLIDKRVQRKSQEEISATFNFCEHGGNLVTGTEMLLTAKLAVPALGGVGVGDR